MMTEPNVIRILIFCLLQLVNVVLSTIRSVTTIKSSKFIAALCNAVYFAFYTLIIIYTVDDSIDLWVKILITFATNLVGVYVGRMITDKLRKDKLWEINATATLDDGECYKFRAELTQGGISYNYNFTSKPHEYVFHIYSKNKKESAKIKEILNKYNANYIVHEENGIL